MENIIYLNEVCKNCNGFCLDIVDLVFVFLMGFVIFKILECLLKID